VDSAESDFVDEPHLDAHPTEHAAPDTKLPQLVHGCYRVVRLLGEGSQGSTCLAIDERNGKEVALKRIDLRAAKEWKSVELFERECRVLQSIHHPAVPRYLEHFNDDGAIYLVMERIVGESLQQVRRRGERMNEAQVWRLLHSVGEILDCLHNMHPPVIHRDIKPHNLVMRPDGSIALVDFGAVRDAVRANDGSTVAGTFGYMAPEQFQGRAFAQSDVYSLGATIVALMTGLEPEQMPHRGLRIDVASHLRASPALQVVLERMLEPDLDLRPKSVQAAMGAYAPSDVSSVSPQSASPADSAASSPRVAGELPWPLAFVVGLVVFALGVPAFILGYIFLPLAAMLISKGGGLRFGKGAELVAKTFQRATQGLMRTAGRFGGQALEDLRGSVFAKHRTKLETKRRAREERARIREQYQAAKRELRDRLRSERRSRRGR
jgi:tRNA A-37 threonylcarbamoyl transferase component Bud32